MVAVMDRLGAGHLGESAAARAFGATVAVTTPEQGLCLVIGREGGVDTAVSTAGGQVVARLAGGRLLALMTWSGLRALWRHPDVRVAGPVSVDPQRFERFCALIGADGDGDGDGDGHG
jgi:hypothetical protein